MNDEIPTPPPEPETVVEPRRRASAIATVFALTVIVLVLAEIAVRWVEPALPTPAGWPDEATATKVEQLATRSASGCTDVVFVGNSMTRDDLSPAVFTAEDPAGRSSYNAALDAASPRLLERWVPDEVLPATSPATVVVGVESMDLNDAAATPAAALRSYDDAVYTADGRFAGIEAWFNRNLALVRNRTALREPTTLASGVVDRVRGTTAARPAASGIDGVIAADGHGLSRRDLRFQGDVSSIRRLQTGFLDPYELDGDQEQALGRLLDTIAASGASPVLLVLPVTDEYIAAHPGGAADHEAFLRALAELADEHGATLIEAPDAPAEEFADTHHLNGTGADRLSARLPALLEDAGVDDRRCTAP